MNDLELVYSTVQQEADATHGFGMRELARISAVTLGIGLLLVLIGVVL